MPEVTQQTKQKTTVNIASVTVHTNTQSDLVNTACLLLRCHTDVVSLF